MTRTLIAGNWKMNGLVGSLTEIERVAAAVAPSQTGPEILLCLPATLIHPAAAKAEGSALKIGGETCHPKEKGAHTGDISAEMLKDAGATYVIVGHSERRADHGETDAVVASQASAALRAGITPIICVGETLAQRDAGDVLKVISEQIAGSIPSEGAADTIVVAYEPVWAIGTGRVANSEQIAEVHGFIRELLTKQFGEAGRGTRILYGGSMNPGNAEEILGVAEVNGGLIGGASLKADDFLAIYRLAAQ
ncbi:triose-phosphate isomerase [Hyphomonas sp. CACIAM 19H1]|uniref:triose-phosphate isomerase n=1 Tax=Hyphomonas sp. CACIAM 19H1 TaxID=1873716 RepID=UPI000DED7810|nr:triose-phosphate isomerase [Hyphomonas sp. CACIAM 19H1]AXE64226.1 triose-phosphate isomerase [Hyphomonas sp. CACIAM 19H1]